MGNTWLLFILACVCGVTVGWELHGLSSFTVPIFMWSDKQIFSKTQVLGTITTGDVEYALASLLNTDTNKVSKLSTALNEDRAKTELVVLFVEPELRTDQVPFIASAYSSTPGGSFSHLKNTMETATSTLALPYAVVQSVSLLDDVVTDLVEEQVNGQIFLSKVSGSQLFSRLQQQSGVKSVAVDSLMSTLTSSGVFSDGVTDLVIVAFDRSTSDNGAEFNYHDKMLGELTSSVSAAAKGNYVAMYAANMPVKNELVWTFEEHSKAEFQRNIELYMLDGNMLGANNSTNHNITVKLNYFPGPFIEALLVSAILITMLFTGACAIFGLQTPDKWEAPKAKREL